MNNMMDGVCPASTEQRPGVAQVGGAVTQIDLDTQQNVARAEEMAAATPGLSRQAQDLVGTVVTDQLDAVSHKVNANAINTAARSLLNSSVQQSDNSTQEMTTIKLPQPDNTSAGLDDGGETFEQRVMDNLEPDVKYKLLVSALIETRDAWVKLGLTLRDIQFEMDLSKRDELITEVERYLARLGDLGQRGFK